MVESRHNRLTAAVDDSYFHFFLLKFQGSSQPPEKRSFSSAGCPFLLRLARGGIRLSQILAHRPRHRDKVAINRGDEQGNYHHANATSEQYLTDLSF